MRNINKTDADLDLEDLYNNYKGTKWLYTNEPIHTTKHGNELIADEIIRKIIKPMADTCNSKLDGNILHKGKKQLTYGEDIELKKYLEELKKYHHTSQETVGACVMTCNPFTKGHYHLIEYASNHVDFLYIFVVEENNFWVPFEDRIEMVRRGTANLKNVTVLPSGLLISRTTFVDYFEKEVNNNAIIDAEKDIMIFRDYIAPLLGINKRFVGEEPSDNITKQYNQQLKENLSDVMEVVEIPRKTSKEGIISASRVRYYCETGDWDKIKEMAPVTTVEYLKQNMERFGNNNNEDKIIRFILQHEQIIICGLGEEGQNLIKQLESRLDAKSINKLEFYDEKANVQNYYYRNKKVIGFEELVSKYKDYYMIIASRKYKEEIFCSLIRNNVNKENIIVIK